MEKKFLQYDAKGFHVPSLFAKQGVGIAESCGSRLTPSPCSIMYPVLLCLNPKEDDAKFFEFSKKAEDGPSRASGFPKTLPEVPVEFRASAASTNRG